MFYLAENLKKYRLERNMTQENVAESLGVTAQSISKWERGECCPDISLLPSLANLFGTSIDMLMGMDEIRAENAKYNIHKEAVCHMKNGKYDDAEKIYRRACMLYTNDPGMILGLASVLALEEEYAEALRLTEKGLTLSPGEKQRATMRAVLCYLYLKCGYVEKAEDLAGTLPHIRECRESIFPDIKSGMSSGDASGRIHMLILGE